MANFDYLDRGRRNIKAHLQSQKSAWSTYIRIARAVCPPFSCHRSNSILSLSRTLAGSPASITAIVGHQVRWAIFSISEARSPIMTQGAIVLPVVTRGMMEPSAIRRLSMPWTLREPSTTDIASCPILAVHV
jgi:hypothetical protein